LTLLPDELECTIDEGRHKTNSQQAEGVTCFHGIKFFLIIHLIRKKNKTLCVLRAFAVQK
jgi:hypothetical protein